MLFFNIISLSSSLGNTFVPSFSLSNLLAQSFARFRSAGLDDRLLDGRGEQVSVIVFVVIEQTERFFRHEMSLLWLGVEWGWWWWLSELVRSFLRIVGNQQQQRYRFNATTMCNDIDDSRRRSNAASAIGREGVDGLPVPSRTPRRHRREPERRFKRRQACRNRNVNLTRDID